MKSEGKMSLSMYIQASVSVGRIRCVSCLLADAVSARPQVAGSALDTVGTSRPGRSRWATGKSTQPYISMTAPIGWEDGNTKEAATIQSVSVSIEDKQQLNREQDRLLEGGRIFQKAVLQPIEFSSY